MSNNPAIQKLLEDALKQCEDKPKLTCDCCGDLVHNVDSNNLCFRCCIVQYTANHLEESYEVCPDCAIGSGVSVMAIVCTVLTELSTNKEFTLETLMQDIFKEMATTGTIN